MFDLTHVKSYDLFSVWYEGKAGVCLPIDKAVKLAENWLAEEPKSNWVKVALIIQDQSGRLWLIYYNHDIGYKYEWGGNHELGIGVTINSWFDIYYTEQNHDMFDSVNSRYRPKGSYTSWSIADIVAKHREKARDLVLMGKNR